MNCCSTWDGNPLLGETALAHARLDGFPLTPGHALVIPKRHVVSFIELTTPELLDVRDLIADVCQASDASSFTIGINDGPDAGRTIDHLHLHVIPRRSGDVPDPRGGVRRVLIPDVSADAWTARHTARATCGETNHHPCPVNAGTFGGQHRCHRSPNHGLFVLHLCSCGEEFHVALDDEPPTT